MHHQFMFLKILLYSTKLLLLGLQQIKIYLALANKQVINKLFASVKTVFIFVYSMLRVEKF